MTDSVTLAALGMVATVVGYLIKQNSGIMAKLSNAIDRLTNRIDKGEARDLKFQETVLKLLKEIDGKADRNFDAMGAQTVNEQHVTKQFVEREVVRQPRKQRR